MGAGGGNGLRLGDELKDGGDRGLNRIRYGEDEE